MRALSSNETNQPWNAEKGFRMHANTLGLSSLIKIQVDDILTYQGDNLHEISKPVFWEKKKKKNIINLSSAEITQIMLSISTCVFIQDLLFVLLIHTETGYFLIKK